jgi:mono/diheme cytochrome c family protein
MYLLKRFINQRLTKAAALCFVSFSVSLSSLASIHEGGDKAKGEKLFKANCASCHRVTDQVLAAPGLAGIKDRWSGKDDLLVQWIQNPQAAYAAGDAYVKGMADKYVPSFGWMTAQAVSKEEIIDILTYVAEGATAATAPDSAASGPDWYTREEESGERKGAGALLWVLFIGVLFLIIAFSASGVRESLKNAVRISEGKQPLPERTYSETVKIWVWKNRAPVGVFGFLITCYVVTLLYISLMGVGVYEGYKPSQPIKFSHKLHAGKNKIDCQYCHHSASKSKHAGIPSVNVCMNCHLGVREGHNDVFTAEIHKIYDAIGFDASTGAYMPNYEEKPVKWNKVHVLPDHVYFSHEQHVSVGGLQCQNCHGPVETYTVGRISPVEQNNKVDLPGIIKLTKPTLTMGWCIECHNNAAVDLASSEYYEEIHRRLKETKIGNRELRKILLDDQVSVKELGGWECAKCHY